MNSYNRQEGPPLQHQALTGFRLRGVDQMPLMAQEEICPILKQYFDFLELALNDKERRVEIELLQEMLLEIVQLLRSGKSQIRDDGYLHLLNRLTNIYARGLQVEDDRAFAGTAASFAAILESVSQQFQNYDYTHSVNLLLHYVDRLYNAREASWLDVYEHLLSMPDSIHIMPQLRIDHLNEINGWIEEGVDNLFTLRDEQLDLLDILDQTISDLELQILTRHAQMRQKSAQGGNILDFSRAQQQQELRDMIKERDQLMRERLTKLDILDLLEANIGEFSDRLAKMRRSTLLKLVWEHPDPQALERTGD